MRDRVRDAGRAGFHSLIGYVRATFLVALVDAVGIGAGLAIMGIPLALPLASLVFLGAFIPLVGAVIAGFLAVVVALIAKGWIFALITLGLIIAVQQLEGHVLQPLVMGRAVSIHPLAIVLAIAGGAVLAGIVGALLAVPAVAFLNSAMRVLLAPDPEAEEAGMEAEDGPLVKSEADDVEVEAEVALVRTSLAALAAQQILCADPAAATLALVVLAGVELLGCFRICCRGAESGSPSSARRTGLGPRLAMRVASGIARVVSADGRGGRGGGAGGVGLPPARRRAPQFAEPRLDFAFLTRLQAEAVVEAERGWFRWVALLTALRTAFLAIDSRVVCGSS